MIEKINQISAEFMVDETERLVENLSDSEQLIRMAFSQSLIPMLLFDEDGRIIMLSNGWTRYSGYTIKDLPNIHEWVNYIVPGRRKEISSCFEKLFLESAPDQHHIYEFINKEGIQRIWESQSTSLGRLSKGKRLFLCQATDISERQENLKLLFDSEVNFRRSLDESPLGIRIVTESGDTVYANHALLNLYGLSSLEEFREAPVSKRYTPESYQGFLERRQKRSESGIATENYEISIVRRSGEIRHLSVIRKEMVWNGSLHYQIIYQDITEKKMIIEELSESNMKAEESDRLKTAFMNNISHEIRTPLNGILGFGEIIATDNLSKEEKEKYLGVLNASSERLINTITDYMDISLLVSCNQTVFLNFFDFRPFLNEIYEQFKQKCEDKKLVCNLLISPELKSTMVKSDRELLRKVFRHLLSNALKFTTQGTIEFGVRENPEGCEFFVKDTGCGIHPSARERVFDYFMQEDVTTTRLHEGSGLGLSITKSVVNLLGGRIELITEKGIGTEFKFILPRYVDQDQGNIRIDKIPSAGKKLILVVEDDIYNSKYIELLLRNSGYEVMVAENGLRAVEACYMNMEIRLVLMDLKMPLLNGFEATQKIRTVRPDLPIIALTAYAQSSEENQAYEAGCNDYVIKPFKKEVILKKVQEQLK